MARGLTRLRWQLTLSHLAAIAFTLVCLVGAAFLFATAVLSLRARPGVEAAEDARLVARAVGGLVSRGDAAALNTVLGALTDGSLLLPVDGPPRGGPPGGPGPPRWADGLDAALENVAYIVVLRPDGQLLASSTPAGAAFAPPEREEWQRLVTAAQADPRDPAALVVRRGGEGPAVLGAWPVVGAGRQPIAVVVVAQTVQSPAERAVFPWRALAFFGAATGAVLAAAFGFALISSSLVAYLLARRLVARLERLGQAAEALRAGDLAARVPVAGADEVTQLQTAFNAMAADLERTLHDLEAERDRAAGLLDARRQLVAAVSHELRTPVATLRGYLETALERNAAVPADLRADLETMAGEVARLQRLIEDLFTLSRAEVGRLELSARPTDVGAVVSRLVDTLAPLAWTQRRVQVLAEVPPDVPAAQADAQRLEQVVSNLLGNAVRHTPPGGLVAAVVAGEPDAVRVDVRDTGEGIAPEELPRVFERFYRGQGADGRGGAGLGLALAKELTEAMGGALTATSTPGEGSCFTVRLPRA
jgi:signal transduction histidine kinase